MLTIQQNLLVQLTKVMTKKEGKECEIKAYQCNFFRLQKKEEKENSRTKQAPVCIARGMPTSGKTSSLTDIFALSCDQVKEFILQHFNGLNPQQTHFQSTAIIESFRITAEHFFKQHITKDALFPDNVSVELELKSARATGQRVHMIDLSVPFLVLCCRMLKRSLYSPRMPFEFLKESFIKLKCNGAAVFSLVDSYKDIIDDYRLQAWDQERNTFTLVAHLAEPVLGKKIFVVKDGKEFEKIISTFSESMMVKLSKELDVIGAEPITSLLIDKVIAGMPEPIAGEFKTALEKYMDRTLGDALRDHSMEPILAPSSGAREVQMAHKVRQGASLKR